MNSTNTTADVAKLSAELIARAEALAPVLAQRAEQAERERRVPTESIREIADAGLFRILQPKRYGGYELPPHVFYRVQIALAKGCMSTAWVYGVVGVHNWQLALFDDRAQQDVWGRDTSVRIASTYMPVGKVTRTDGGFRLSGRWGFSSGIDHADWVFLGALVFPEDGKGPPDYRTFLVPKSDYRVVDTWHVLGLKGTGSQDVVVEDAFVPEYRTHRSADGAMGTSPGNKINTAALYKLPFAQVFVRAVSTACIGGLQGAIDAFRAYSAERVSKNTGAKTVEDPGAQRAIADAMTLIDSLKLTLFRNFDALGAYAKRGEIAPLDERLLYRFQSSQVANVCARAVDELLRCSGGNGIYTSNPLVRIFLDTHAARGHIASHVDMIGRNLGGVQFGLPNTDYFC